MQSKLLAAFAFALAIVTAPSAVGAQTGAKVAYINSQLILEQTPQRAQLEQQFEREIAPIRNRLRAMEDSFAALVQAYQKDEAALAADAKTARQREITDKQARWQLETDSLRTVAAAKQAEIERPLTELLRKTLSDIRMEEGYWFILDLAAEGHGIVAIDRNLDITDRVLARFRVAAATIPKPDSSSVPAGGPIPSAAGVTRRIPPPLR